MGSGRSITFLGIVKDFFLICQNFNNNNNNKALYNKHSSSHLAVLYSILIQPTPQSTEVQIIPYNAPQQIRLVVDLDDFFKFLFKLPIFTRIVTITIAPIFLDMMCTYHTPTHHIKHLQDSEILSSWPCRTSSCTVNHFYFFPHSHHMVQQTTSTIILTQQTSGYNQGRPDDIKYTHKIMIYKY